MSKGNKINVKDYLDGDEFDLSLQTLTTATLPVKELAALKKGRKLDLSKNQILALPDNFVSSMGQHLVMLDLSGNGLVQLPVNFGNMALLQHLDLFNNKLTALPLSFFKLKMLKWLDLKENPLEYPPTEIVGLCRNDTECKTCALQVLDFMKKENADQERQKQKELELKRAKKEALKRELERLEELENMEKKRIKQEEKTKEKARRRADYEERMRLEQKEKLKKQAADTSTPPATPSSTSTTPSFFSAVRTISLLAALVFLMVAVVVASVIQPDFNEQYQGFRGLISHVSTTVGEVVNVVITSINSQLLENAPGLQKSISSASELFSEMLVISRDTLHLGCNLAYQEYLALSTYLHKY